MVRVHSKCLTGDVFHSARCDCGPQLKTAMQRIAAEGRGVLLYLNQEGRGIGLANKIRAYELQDQGLRHRRSQRTPGLQGRSAGLRDRRPDSGGAGRAGPCACLRITLRKFIGLQGYGLSVSESVPLEVLPATEFTRKYLKTKKDKLGHKLSSV